jgi:hypothetical protein
MAVTGSSGDSPSTCFTITLNANCAHPEKKFKEKNMVSQSRLENIHASASNSMMM